MKPNWSTTLRKEIKDTTEYNIACCQILLKLINKELTLDTLKELPMDNGLYRGHQYT